MSATATQIDLAGLLGEQAASGASGLVNAVRGKHRRLFCLGGGKLIFVASNLIEEQFEETLIRRELATREAIDGARAAAAAAKLKPARYLIEQGGLDREQAMEALRAHVTELVVSTLGWKDGELSFAAGRPNLGQELTVELDCARAVLPFFEALPGSRDRLRSQIGSPETRLRLHDDRVTLLDAVEPPELASYLEQHCKGSLDLTTLVNGAPVDPEPTLRILQGLLRLGIVERNTAKARAAANQPTAELTREECLERARTSEGADHYAILGVERGADDKVIKDAYYHFARRYHPDRFRSGDLQDLLEPMEAFFARVTEAHNALSDAERRREYDRQLAGPSESEAAVADAAPENLARQNYARGKTLVGRGRFQDALPFLENAVKLDGSKAVYHLQLGLVLVKNPRARAEAQAALETAVELDPSLVSGYLGLGQLCLKAGRNDEAAARFREVLRWEPGNVDAQAALEKLEKPAAGRGLRSLFRR